MFGKNVDIAAVVWEALKEAPTLKPTDTALLMLDRYETAFGIYDHNSDLTDRPLALVAMHPAEDAVTNSLLHEKMDEFVSLQITKKFGLSWTEFIEQTPDMCEMMLIVARKKQEEEARLTNDITNRLQEASRLNAERGQE